MPGILSRGAGCCDGLASEPHLPSLLSALRLLERRAPGGIADLGCLFGVSALSDTPFPPVHLFGVCLFREGSATGPT
jgi:hypothetical protein